MHIDNKMGIMYNIYEKERGNGMADKNEMIVENDDELLSLRLWLQKRVFC